MLATSAAPPMPSARMTRPTVPPSAGESAVASWPIVRSGPAPWRRAAATTSTAAMTICVTIAPATTSSRTIRRFRDGQPLLHDRALLVEDHPRHHDGADVRRDEREVAVVAQRLRRDEASCDRGQVRVRHRRRDHEGELERAEHEPDDLDAPVAAGDDERDERRGRDRHRRRPRHAEQLADAGEPGELGDEGAHDGDDERADRDRRPRAAEVLPDQLREALPGRDRQPRRELQHDDQHGHEGELDEQQPVAPGGARLGRRDDAAGVRVREHHHQARARARRGRR